MQTIQVGRHGERVNVQVLSAGQRVYYNGHRCIVETVFSDGDVMLKDIGTGMPYCVFANFCTTMQQAG